MTTPTAGFERFSVWLLPFPFTDKLASKRRPAVVVSSEAAFNTPAGHSVMAMITSARHSAWPLDVSIGELGSAGLPAPSVVRMKLFTLDHRLALRPLGMLAGADQEALEVALARLLTNGPAA
ncbi:MAG: type II toxin-antitoxin system PemK/MazF family toxin [Deinococcota bacterium]|jgi:mRNA interferase MazF|nr:type II toxin-antitoxin system PemK/MazF family toxin [Deinococcota bacterium]